MVDVSVLVPCGVVDTVVIVSPVPTQS